MARDHQTGALLFVDLDRFKQVNDTQGHARRRHLAAGGGAAPGRMRARQDCIGRLSGDEFVLLLSNCTTEQAVQTAQRVLGSIAMPVTSRGRSTCPAPASGFPFIPMTALTSTPGAPC